MYVVIYSPNRYWAPHYYPDISLDTAVNISQKKKEKKSYLCEAYFLKYCFKTMLL